MKNKRAESEACHLYTLAKGSTAHVQRCTHCNSLSLHVGPVTLRFDAGALESLWNTLGEALLQLHSDTKPEYTQVARSRRAGQA